MDRYKENIDNLIRSKFDSYEPVPPPHIWEEVQKGIVTTPVPFFTKKRLLSATAILVLTLAGFFIFYPFSSSDLPDKINSQDIVLIEDSDITSNEPVVDIDNSAGVIKEPETNNTVTDDSENTQEYGSSAENHSSENSIDYNNTETVIATGQKATVKTSSNLNSSKNSNNMTAISYYMSLLNLRTNFTIENEYEDYNPKNRTIMPVPEDLHEIEVSKSPARSAWKIGYYLSPEITVSNIDSVEIMNTYSFNIEPSYFFNDHLFISSGIGLSYARDRGYAKINYVVNEYMGSYDDVYDVTFDTLQGNIVPVYHTKTVDVWDTVRHVSIASISNQYLYLQIPVLIGYSYQISNSPVSWYIYGGPAMYLKTAEWIENPVPKEENADIIDLKNNLPVRADAYYQIWIGSGLQYQFNNKLSLAVEPGYRHYLSNIYSNTDNKGPSSGFNLRFGLIYKMK